MSLNGSGNGAPLGRLRTWLRWLEPGLGVKRWVAAMAVGVVLISTGAALI